MRRAVIATLLLLGWMLAARLDAVSKGGGPSLERSQGNGVVLTRLPTVLSHQEVRRHLGTGLTTTLAFEVRVPGSKARGGARIDVRYELWDEVWLVTRADTSGRTQRASFPSFERLEVLPGSGAGDLAEVRMRVIPFSQSEQLDAQRWFSRSLAEQPSGSAGAVSGILEEPSGELFNLLLATSIRRPALLEFEWKVKLPGARR